MLLNGAANRDPRKFKQPDEFWPDRSNAHEHLAFGHGAHFCPGAPLARTEGRVAVQRLLERTTEIRISEAMHGSAGQRRYRYLPTYMLRGVQALHLELTGRDVEPREALRFSKLQMRRLVVSIKCSAKSARSHTTRPRAVNGCTYRISTATSGRPAWKVGQPAQMPG